MSLLFSLTGSDRTNRQHHHLHIASTASIWSMIAWKCPARRCSQSHGTQCQIANPNPNLSAIAIVIVIVPQQLALDTVQYTFSCAQSAPLHGDSRSSSICVDLQDESVCLPCSLLGLDREEWKSLHVLDLSSDVVSCALPATHHHNTYTRPSAKAPPVRKWALGSGWEWHRGVLREVGGPMADQKAPKALCAPNVHPLAYRWRSDG